MFLAVFFGSSLSVTELQDDTRTSLILKLHNELCHYPEVSNLKKRQFQKRNIHIKLTQLSVEIGLLLCLPEILVV